MINFKNQEELKRRVYPALISKSTELKRRGYNYTEDDIWSYLSTKVYPNMKDLELVDVIDEIINLDINKLTEYKN